VTHRRGPQHVEERARRRRVGGAVEETAARLHEAGVRRGDRVGVRMPSGSKELYISILGILAAGAAYVPVDADDPDERARLVFTRSPRRTPASCSRAAVAPTRAISSR
jgi:non-ribosomal peptide synthetase component F